jgi:flagellar hook-length control protein FliK
VAAVHELQSQAASAALSETLPEDLPEALRLRLEPNQFITQRLAAMAGTGEQATWGSVAGQSVASGLLRLDMRGLHLIDPSNAAADQAVAGDESAGEGLSGPGGAHPLQEPSRSAPQAAASTATPWTSTAAQRAEQYEQLAQRLGEALGQRLQSQLERGDWKLQMRLDPAHLGRIDLDLDMSAGGLDAVFRSDNQVTRDLIAQSLGRLRESLSQSGTAVANVWVQGDSSRQSGGNPTPGRAPDQQEGRASGRDAGSDERIAATAVQRPRQGTSAWDVLA